MIVERPFLAVTPSVDGDVLVVLAGADAEFTATQVHDLAATRSLSGVRKALVRLTAYGLVSARQAGTGQTNPWLYRLNRDHLLAGPVVQIVGARTSFLERLRHLLSSWDVAPRYAALFGSAATGGMRPDGDIDILVVRPDDIEPDDDAWADQLTALTSSVTAWTGNDTQLLEYGHDDLRTAIAAGARVLEDVRGDAITLFGDRTMLR